MKKNKLLFLLLIPIILTGCIKYEFDSTINNNKQMDLTILLLVKEEYEQSINKEQTQIKDDETYKKIGFKVIGYKDNNGYTGKKLTKTLKNIDDYSTDKDIIFDFNELLKKDDKGLTIFKKEKNGSKTKYTANLVFDFSDTSISTSDMSNYTSELIFQYEVYLPNSAISNNATKTSKDNKHLLWDLEYGKKTEVKYEFEIDDKDKNNLVTYNKDKNDLIEEEDNSKVEKEAIKETKKEEQATSPFKRFIAFILSIGIIAILVYVKIKNPNIKTKTNIKHKVAPKRDN